MKGFHRASADAPTGGRRRSIRTLAIAPVVAAAALAVIPAAALADGFTGTVYDGSTAIGLGGVTVTATDQGTAAQTTTTTAADGTYTLDGLTDGDSYSIQYSEGGYSTLFYDNETAAPGDTQTVPAGSFLGLDDQYLLPSGGLSGNVSGASGGAGVEIQVVDAGGNCPAETGYDEDACGTETDANGNWSVTGLPNGTYFVEALPASGSGQNYVDQWYGGGLSESSAVQVTVANGAVTSSVNFAMQTGAAISGNVTDAQTGGPAGGVGVDALDASGGVIATTTTDGNGNYSLTGLTSGTYSLVYGGNGYLDQFYGGAVSQQSSTPVVATVGTNAAPINMTVQEASQGGTIAGTVGSASTGAAVGGVNIELYDANNNPVAADYFGNGPVAGQTNSSGAYQISDLIASNYKIEYVPNAGNLAFQFYSGQPTIATANLVEVGPGAVTPNVNVSLSPGGQVNGQVTDAVSHAQLGGAEVYLEDATGNILEGTATNPDGTYTMGGIPAGSTYHVEFDDSMTLPGGGSYSTQWWNKSLTFGSSQPVPVTAGAATAGIDAALTSYVGTVTPSVPAPTPPAPKPGPAKLSHKSLKGLSKGKATLKFTVTSGTNGAPKVKSVKVTLPKGKLSFVSKAKTLKKNIKVKGAKVSEKLKKGVLTLTFKSATGKATITIGPKALKVSKKLRTEAKKGKDKHVDVHVTITNSKKQSRKAILAFEKPK